MSIVSGRDVLLKIQNGSTYQIIGCNASCSLEINTDTYETTFVGDGSYRGFIPNKHTIVLNGDGPISLDTGISPVDVIGLQLARVLISWSFSFTDTVSTITYSGTGYLTRCTITGAVGGNPATCDYTIQVSDSLTITGGSSGGSGESNTFDYDATGGETSIGDAGLIGATILYVARNGIGVEVVTGTPGASQCKFNSGAGTITFGTALGAGEWIHVIYD